MSKLVIHAGTFPTGNGELKDNHLILPGRGLLNRKTVALSDLASVEIASEESVKRIGGTIGWGAAGAVVLGPVGLLAGLLIGGKGKDVTFIAKFKDDRFMLATTDQKSYTKLLALTLS